MLSRASVVRANAPALRRVAGRRTCQRFQSTAPVQGSASTHAAAGVAGGAVVVLAGYTWYHFSGLKTAVQTSHQVKTYFENARDTVVEKARKNTGSASDALAYLRSVAKSYSSFVPGASSYVDSTFDSLDELQETHGEEMNKILKGATDELTKVVQDGGADAATAAKVYEVLRRRVAELQELGVKVGGDILDMYPQAKEALGGGYEQLKKLSESGGPEAKKIFDDTTSQIKDIVSKGKLSSDSIDQARQLLQDKASQLQKMAAKAGGGAALSLGGGWEKLQSFVETIPGGKEELEKLPHVKDFMNVAGQRGEEAKELAKEAYQDILKVLEEKGKKAQKLTEETKEDAKGAKDKSK